MTLLTKMQPEQILMTFPLGVTTGGAALHSAGPLAKLQVYFYTQDHSGPCGRMAMTAGLVLSTLVTTVGIFAASMMLWLPGLG